jgi:hypothetical protein
MTPLMGRVSRELHEYRLGEFQTPAILAIILDLLGCAPKLTTL